MLPRSPSEEHRVATPLELLFDLVFVVAIAQAASGLHHAISGAHSGEGLLSYGMVFFGIWWAWMAFTWFASAYDCDDVPYRLAVFVQITGALIFAAGVPSLFVSHQINGLNVGGYVVMRLAAVGLWIRASRSDPKRRVTTLRYAGGVTAVQCAWIALLYAPQPLAVPGFVTLAIVELLVPMWAESVVATTWHPHHITERYGLFTIIVLGESILTATVAIEEAVASGERMMALAPLIVGGLLIVYAFWWLYFYRPVHDLIVHVTLKRLALWGYGHYLLFASAAAVGAGLAVQVDFATGKAVIGHVGAGAAVAIPVAIYISALWVVHFRSGTALHMSLGPIAAVLILLTPWTSQPVLITGIILSLLVASKLTGVRAQRVAHS